MSETGVDVFIDLLVFAVFFVLLLIVRRPVQARLFAGTGVQEWRAVARELPWRDRWILFSATSRGKATSPRLAGLAVQRGRAMSAANAGILSRGSKLNRLYPLVGVLGVLNLVINLIQFANGDRGFSTWSGIGSALLLTALGFGWRPIHRWQAKLTERSVRRNELLLRHEID